MYIRRRAPEGIGSQGYVLQPTNIVQLGVFAWTQPFALLKTGADLSISESYSQMKTSPVTFSRK